ncbi:hypothetical protein GOODEAATRI_006494, partial [Goodea atripinnis]
TGSAERRKHRSHKFLCLRVGKPMKKTFVSNASASMQQYAQQGKKNEYWFAVPQERSVLRHLPTNLEVWSCLFVCVWPSQSQSEHLYVFFMQWSPDMYGEGIRGMGQEPGFMVIKKNVASETPDDEPINDLNVKEWEVRSECRSFLTRPEYTGRKLSVEQHGVSCCWTVADFSGPAWTLELLMTNGFGRFCCITRTSAAVC